MRDTRQRMVSISLHAYLMLIAPLSRLTPRRPVTDHKIVLCLKAGLAAEDGPWGLNGELGNARFSRLAQARSITDRQQLPDNTADALAVPGPRAIDRHIWPIAEYERALGSVDTYRIHRMMAARVTTAR